MFIHGNKKYLNLRDAIEMINVKAEMKFTERQVVRCYGMSKMSTLDTVKDPTGPVRLSFPEFLEFIGRISHEFFKDTPFLDEPLHIKIDMVLTRLFHLVRYTKVFTYLEQYRQNVVTEILTVQRLQSSGEGEGGKGENSLTETPRNLMGDDLVGL